MSAMIVCGSVNQLVAGACEIESADISVERFEEINVRLSDSGV